VWRWPVGLLLLLLLLLFLLLFLLQISSGFSILNELDPVSRF
jgi:hypothetical protein